VSKLRTPSVNVFASGAASVGMAILLGQGIRDQTR
jgi:hypothetical protein